jgi:hypothetical protein
MHDAFESQRKEMLRHMSEDADNSADAQRRRVIEALGTRYVLHPSNAPAKGVYNPTTGAPLSYNK